MILETKLTMPQPKAGALLRSGLLEHLKNNLDKKLILITADAGYGKTTLLSQLVQEARLPAVFYDLDKGDSDLLVFYSYLLTGLEKISPGLATRSAVLLRPGAAGNNYELLMGTLINELAEKRREEIFFVLDDYQYLTEDSPVHQALDFFIDHMPDIVHLIIAARGVVDFSSLAKWTAKQDAYSLTREHLAFNTDEAQELLAKNYEVVTKEDIQQILEHTEGWITGIQLILRQTGSGGQRMPINEILAGYLQTKQSAPSGEELFQYFVKEIFRRESQPVMDFLIKTSIADTIDPGTGNALSGITQSREMLEDLEKRNIFISMIGSQQYKYHRLFRDFLQLQNTDRFAKERLHQKAGDYYRGQRNLDSAIAHYLKARNYREAGRIILSVADSMLSDARLEALDNWLGQLPQDAMNKEPELLVYKGAVCRVKGNISEAEKSYLQVEQMLEARSRPGRLNTRESCVLARALLKHGDILWMKGNNSRALKLVARSLRFCPKSKLELKMPIINLIGLIWGSLGNYNKEKASYLQALRISQNKNISTKIAAANNLANLYIRRGQMRLAGDMFGIVHQNINGRYFIKVGVYLANMAKTALLQGDVSQAERYLEEGWNLCAPYEDKISKAALNSSFGSLYLHQARWDLAKSHLEKAYQSFDDLEWETGKLMILKNFSRLCRYQGDNEKSAEYLKQALDEQGKMDTVTRMGFLIELAFVHIADKQFELAGTIIKDNAGQVDKMNLGQEQISICLIKSAIALSAGRKKKALELLGKAVDLTRRRGFDGSLVQELRYNSKLAGLVPKLRVPKIYLDRLRFLIDAEAVRRPAARIDLRARLFGPLQVLMPQGKEIPVEWKSRKVVSLFAYLLLHRERWCEREELMKNLWPQKELKQAYQDLRNSVYWLKKAIAKGLNTAGAGDISYAKIIISRQKSYRVNPEISWRLDTDDFVEQWQKAQTLAGKENVSQRAECCRQGLELYRDGFLTNLDDSWCEQKRTGLQKTYGSFLKLAADDRLGNDDHKAAIEYYRRYIELEPLLEEVDEGLHNNFWRALKAEGRISEIQSDYQRLLQTMSNDYGRELSPNLAVNYSELTSTKGSQESVS